MLEVCNHNSNDRCLHKQFMDLGSKWKGGYPRAIGPVESSFDIQNDVGDSYAEWNGVEEQEMPNRNSTISF